jgi:MoaA/NifB/PqqE/SkfB family radical SAM enzyme
MLNEFKHQPSQGSASLFYRPLDWIKGRLLKHASKIYHRKGLYRAVVFGLSRNRAFNYLNYKWAVRRIRRLHQSPPQTLLIESTNSCNAMCSMCAFPFMKRQKGYMSQEVFEKIVEDASRSGIELINLQSMGEPLLDRKFFERVRLIKQHGLKVMFHTNGSLLDKEKAGLTLEAGVDMVSISIDAFTKETYERIRRGLSLEEVVKNVTNLMEMKKRQKRQLPIVKLNYALLDENAHEVSAFYNFWHKKVDHVNVNLAMDWAGQLDVKSHLSLHITNHPPFLNPCEVLWEEMVVLWDGRVSLCCLDYEGSVIMGDLKNQSIIEVWLGKKLQRYRNEMLEAGRSSLPLCNTCSRYSFWL